MFLWYSILFISRTKVLKSKIVLLCPTGEHARILSFHSLPTDIQPKVLDQWAEFYNMPSSLLTQKKEYMPSLITIRTASQDTVIYPSALVFVPTDTKQSPAAVAGMNGIMGLNHGLTEDLGAKASRTTYYKRLKLNTQEKDAIIIDYWSYKDPIIYVGNSVIHALSSIDAKYQQDQIVLHRALVEPVVGSPIMKTKSVVPTNYDSPLLMSGLHRKSVTPPESNQNDCKMQLTEFVKSQFHIKQEDDLDAKLLLEDSSIALNSNDSLDLGGGSYLSALLHKNLIIDSTDNLPISTSNNSSEQIYQPQPQPQPQLQQTFQPQLNQNVIMTDLTTKDEHQDVQPPLEDFNLMYDLGGTKTSHEADAWDMNDGFGDLDLELNLDVTDADFDFFETTAAPTIEPNVLNIIPMDIDPPNVIDEIKPQAHQDPVDQDILMPDVQVSTPNNNDSLFTPFIISNESTEDVSAATTMEVTSYSTPQIADTSILQKRTPYQKSTPEPYTFVPRDFLPVPVKTSVNDAKYGAGGKFMYNPSKDRSELDVKGSAMSKKKESYYSPDYIPIAPKKKLDKSKQHEMKALETDALLKNENKVPWSNKNGDSNSSCSSTNSYSSGSSGTSSDGSSSGSSSFSTDDNDDDASDGSESESYIDQIDDLIENNSMVEKRLRILKKFQKTVVYSQLRATPAPLPTDRLQYLDYDTPFAPILAYGSIKPIKWRHSKAMEGSMEYMCEQAVLGGYPLAGGLAEVSGNGGEIEGEPAKVLVARRNNLMQMTRGVVTHVPSLQADVFNMTNDFKSILQDIFIEPFDMNNTTNSMETLPDALEPVSYPNGPLLGKVDIKGPLNIQEYYDLNGMYRTFIYRYFVVITCFV